MILAGDIGGTNTRLALFEGTPDKLHAAVIEIFPSSKYKSLSEIVRLFRAGRDQPIAGACFGVAGPVQGSTAKLPNLDWETIDASRLATDLGLSSVRLANDLEANAYGIAAVTADDFATLQAGTPGARGNQVLISAGTGLGEAGLLADGGDYKPWACEGGHTDFAPRNQTQIALLQYLLKEFDHVSNERVLSGPGLYNIYKFLRDTTGAQEPLAMIDAKDPAAVISELAMKNENLLCVWALDMCVEIYGAEAGNLALKGMATGGVYIGGGIAPKILTKLQSPLFLNAFTAKGRSTPLMHGMPIRVILNDKTALLGAARLAMLGSKSQ